jgi:hypothetical protein
MFVGTGRPGSERATAGTATDETAASKKAAVNILAFIFFSILKLIKFS